MANNTTLDPKNYNCESCGKLIIAPIHCGRPMRIEEEKNEDYWICWKGDHAPCCGRESYAKIRSCCNNPSLVSDIENSGSKILL